MSDVDYRVLLAKYVQHVGECEGVDFIDKVNGGIGSEVVFTPEEVAALNHLTEPDPFVQARISQESQTDMDS